MMSIARGSEQVQATDYSAPASHLGFSTEFTFLSFRVLHAGRSTAFCEAEARDAEGRMLATAIGTFRLLADQRSGKGPSRP